MSAFQQYNEAAEALKKAKANLVAEYLPKLTDKSISLDDRWTLFSEITTVGALKHNGYGNGYIKELCNGDKRGLSLFDDFYLSRYETIKYIDMYDTIIEIVEDGNDNLNVDAWREAVLASGDDSMTHDW